MHERDRHRHDHLHRHVPLVGVRMGGVGLEGHARALGDAVVGPVDDESEVARHDMDEFDRPVGCGSEGLPSPGMSRQSHISSGPGASVPARRRL